MLLKYQIIKSVLIILIIALIGVMGLFGYGFKAVESQGVTFAFAGWIWSDNYGWISLNSDNCLLLNPGECFAAEPQVEYKVQIDSANRIYGYGWSENVGWVCFGDDCTNSTMECPGAVLGPTSLDGNSGKISGWAKVCSLGSDGWIKLGRGVSVGASSGEACYDCQPKCEVLTEYIDGDGNKIYDEPCIKYSTTEFDSCNTCFSQTNFSGIDYPAYQDPDINVPDFVVGGSGNIYTSCQDCVSETILGVSRITCSRCDASVPTSLELYGVNRNSSDGRLLGWSWNGAWDTDDQLVIGAGWLHFNTEFGSSYIVFPWLQTLYSSIYTPNWVRQKAGVEGNNATYCILAQDINVNVKSQNCEDIASGLVQGVETGYLQPSLSSGIYRNALGKIDITGMIKIVTGNRNKYGQLVESLSQNSWSGPSEGKLEGKVYYFNGNLNVVGNTKFENSSTNASGNGIIIVNGNLTIKNDISYGLGLPAKLNQLASVTWIVKGDVIIDPKVKNIVGAFVILGNGATCQKVATSDPDYHRYIQNGCGVFFSSEPGQPDSDESLTVLGLVIARAFDFGRTFAEILQGSERIIYDGRLTANPPKALSGFVEGLPVVRDFSY